MTTHRRSFAAGDDDGAGGGGGATAAAAAPPPPPPPCAASAATAATAAADGDSADNARALAGVMKTNRESAPLSGDEPNDTSSKCTSARASPLGTLTPFTYVPLVDESMRRTRRSSEMESLA